MDGSRVQLTAFADEVRHRVERRLDGIFSQHSRLLAASDARLSVLGDAVCDLSMRGGKRLRAVLAATGFVAVSPDADLEPAVRAGAAFELLQTYFLIHDDWMDGDELRRGGPATHVGLARRLGGPHLGACGAILAGDYAMALAQAELASAPCRAEAVLTSLRHFAEVQKATVAGQFLDITGGAAESREYLLEELKTCSYTVHGPLLIGATLGGASPELLEACRAYARPAGIAFQLRDDLLGLFGDSAVTGKGRGNDLRAGKMTHVVRDALRNAESADSQVLRAVLGQAHATDDLIHRALGVLRSSGAVARTEERIATLRAEANQSLRESAGFSRRSIEYLTELAARLTERAT